jgi:hypothetical protein
MAKLPEKRVPPRISRRIKGNKVPPWTRTIVGPIVGLGVSKASSNYGEPRRVGDVVNLKLRLPEMLRLRLERVASRNGQSMNTEILQRLVRSFQQDAIQKGDPVRQAAEAILSSLDDAVVMEMVDIINRKQAEQRAADYARSRDENFEVADEEVARRNERNR